MRALIITEDETKRIAEILRYAKANVFSMDDMLDVMNGQAKPAGDNPAFVVRIPMGYLAAFSYEQQNKGLYRHISISVNAPGSLPHKMAVQAIIEAFGFKKKLEELLVTIEEITPSFKAVSVHELVEDGDST